MSRNTTIYALVEKIYIAEAKPSINKQGTVTKGGTWNGAMQGLKKGRKIFIRKPDENEYNDNNLLIDMDGSIPVDINGNEIPKKEKRKYKQQKLFN
jgi:predicted Rossmann fold nucleotide-binding protein DprA/Smf involved in DNA uptake